MNWKKAIGLGILLWVLMFVIVSILIAFKLYEFRLVRILIAVIAGLISLFLAGMLKPGKVGLALAYGFIWVVIGVILDAIVTMRFNPAIFSAKTLWLGYLLILLAPLLKVKKTSEMPKPPLSV